MNEILCDYCCNELKACCLDYVRRITGVDRKITGAEEERKRIDLETARIITTAIHMGMPQDVADKLLDHLEKNGLFYPPKTVKEEASK